jgi:4-amino-4-deoxychorismate lyase
MPGSDDHRDPEDGPGPHVVAVLGRGLVSLDTPVVTADDAGLTRGDGCFEGLRLVDGAIMKLDRHLDRMTRSAAALGIPFDRSAWRALAAEAVTSWAPAGEAAVKFVLTRGPAAGNAPTGYVMISPLPADYPRQRREGLRVITLQRGLGPDVFADAPWLLGGVKTLSYAVNMAAQREAARRGADDALFLAANGTVLEAPTGSVIWAVGRALHTTPLGGTGILAGTTQALLFDRAAEAGWSTHWTAVTLEELQAADVVWLASSVRGPVDVVELDGVARERRPDIDAEIRRLAGF